MLQDFDKQFINWTIAQLKKNKKPVNVMIENLKRQGKPELAQYAESVEPTIKPEDEGKYAQEFQRLIVKECMTSGNPKAFAKQFFKATGIDPKTSELGKNITKELKEKIFFLGR